MAGAIVRRHAGGGKYFVHFVGAPRAAVSLWTLPSFRGVPTLLNDYFF
jgi:hypothetical protein